MRKRTYLLWSLIAGLFILLAPSLLTTASPVKAAATQSDFQPVIQKRSSQSDSYQLELTNLKNRTYRDIDITVKPKGNAIKSGTEIHWHVKSLGSSRAILPFKISDGVVSLSGKDAQVSYSHKTVWLIAGGVAFTVIVVGGVIYFRRSHYTGTEAIVLLLIGGSLTALIIAHSNTAQAAGQEHAEFTSHIRINGSEQTFKTSLTYSQSDDHLVLYTGTLAPSNTQGNQKLIFTNLKTRAKQTVTTASDGSFRTRLVAKAGYKVSGPHVNFNLKPNKYAFQVTNLEKATVNTSTESSNGITTTLQADVQKISNTASPKVNPNNETAILSDINRDIRVGDVVVFPAFGFYYGGLAAKVTGVTLDPTDNTTRIKFAEPKLDHVVDTVKGEATVDVAKNGVFVPAVPAATAGTKTSLDPIQIQTGFIKYKSDDEYSLSEEIRIDLTKLLNGKVPGSAKDKGLSGSLSFKIDNTINVKTDISTIFNHHAKFSLKDDLGFTQNLKLKQELKSKPHNYLLGTIPVIVGGGMSIDMPLYLTISAEGTVSLEAQTTESRTIKASYNSTKKKKFSASAKPKNEFTFGTKLHAEAKVGITPGPELRLLSLEVVQIEPEAGLKLTGDASGSYANENFISNSTSADWKITLMSYAELTCEIPIAGLFGGADSFATASIEQQLGAWGPRQEAKKKVTKEKTDNSKMNFAAIQKGNYSSLLGNWQLVANAANYRGGTGFLWKNGGTGNLSITKNKITDVDMSLLGNTLTDNNGDHPVVYKQLNDGTLSAGIVDPGSVAINWNVTFIPKGTSYDWVSNYRLNNNVKIDKADNLIVIWSSNDSFTEVFAQGPVKKTTVATGKGLNVSQIAQNNFASLVGTWKNETDGKTIVVTNQTMNKPTGSHVAPSIGAVVSGADNNGYPEVITSGTITDGYIQGGIGTFDPSIMGSAFEPFLIVPKNVKLPAAQGLYDTDDSDTTRDRLVRGIQSGNGVQPHAYYRQ